MYNKCYEYQNDVERSGCYTFLFYCTYYLITFSRSRVYLSVVEVVIRFLFILVIVFE